VLFDYVSRAAIVFLIFDKGIY